MRDMRVFCTFHGAARRSGVAIRVNEPPLCLAGARFTGYLEGTVSTCAASRAGLVHACPTGRVDLFAWGEWRLHVMPQSRWRRTQHGAGRALPSQCAARRLRSGIDELAEEGLTHRGAPAQRRPTRAGVERARVIACTRVSLVFAEDLRALARLSSWNRVRLMRRGSAAVSRMGVTLVAPCDCQRRPQSQVRVCPSVVLGVPAILRGGWVSMTWECWRGSRLCTVVLCPSRAVESAPTAWTRQY